jgi:hypothetical protein
MVKHSVPSSRESQLRWKSQQQISIAILSDVALVMGEGLGKILRQTK